jgi:hypothetical protein
VHPDADGCLALVAAVEVADGLDGSIGEEEVDLGIILDLQLAHLETVVQKGELGICTAASRGPGHISL